MIDARWDDIVCAINSLAYSVAYYFHVKKKWFDMKNKAKCDFALHKKEPHKTDGGENNAPKPTKMQFKIPSIIGNICSEDIPGTDECDTSLIETILSRTVAMIPLSMPNPN